MANARWLAVVGGIAIASGAVRYDLGALRWRNIGPNRGGRSQAVAGSARRPLEYYFGATGGGLWKTTNGGTTWFPVTDGQIHSSSPGAVAVAESNPDIVYLGMGETELRGNIMQGDGIYRSTDAGKTWRHIGLADTQAIARIRVHPSDPNRVYVAALGHPHGKNSERGVFRSTDGGANWKRVLFRDERSGAADLSMDAHNPQVLFASLWEVYRTPWMLSSGGAGSGLFKSVDGGDTWTEITRAPGLPKGIVGKITVSVSPADSRRVYALVEAEDGGLFQSNDAGATWTLVSEDRRIRQRAFYFSRILADPKDADTVYAMNVEFYRSRDGGRTFSVVHTPHADHHDLWIAADDPERMIGANDGGGTVSTDGGKTWTAEHYPTAQIYHVATTKDIPYHVCGAQQDVGTVCVPSGAGRNYRDPEAPAGDWLYAAGGGEAGYVTPDPRDANIFYAGDQAGIVTRYDRRTGESRAINVYPLFFSGMAAKDLKERWQWTFPIVFSPLDPRILYTSSQHLWMTTSEGQRWERISPDLTRNDPATLGDSGGPITKDQNGPEIYGTIFTIAPSRLDVNTIWTGSDDGLVQVTRDGGKTWSNVTPPGLGEFNRVGMIDASPHAAGAAYVAAKRYQLDDRRPYIFRTKDYGKTWSRIVAGIPEDDFVHVVREDPRRAGLLYAGAEHGVYVSFDDGAEWQSLALNLPDTQIADMVVEQNDVVIATHGRSFYVLDDIAVLRQLTPEAWQASAHLYEPSPAVRSLHAAVIDYSLARAGGEVRVEIEDADGRLVHGFDAPAAKAGLSRLVWDLQAPGAATFPGLVLRWASPGAGPVVPPGKYTVRMTAGDVVRARTLTVEKDPRLTGVSDADLQAQYRLAVRIRDRTSAAHAAVARIREVRGAVDARVAKAGDLAAAAESLKGELAKVEEELYQVRNRSPRDTLNYPIKLNNQLAVLGMLVEMGNARPTDQDYAVFEELSAELSEILGRLDRVWSVDLPRFNQMLAAKGLAAVGMK